MIEDPKIKKNTEQVKVEYIPGNNKLNFSTGAIKIEPKNSIVLTGTGYPKLSPPIIIAKFEKQEDCLVFEGLVFVDSNYGAVASDFSFYLNYTLGSDGNNKLNLFILLDKKSSGATVEKYDVFSYKIIINKVIHTEILMPLLSKIITIEAFMIDRDPETSRGTVTTVKSTTGQ